MFIFLDTETTGTGPDDRLCQIAFKTEEGLIVNELFNPGKPISIEAMSIHHITNEMVKDKPPFKGSDACQKLHELVADDSNVIVAHNAKFDTEMLNKEGIYPSKAICTYKLARYLDKDGIIPRYNLQYLRYYTKQNIDAVPHSALGDILVVEGLFNRLHTKFREVSKADPILEMINISNSPVLIRRMPFGKHKGLKMDEIPLDYLEWLLTKDLDEDLAYTVRHHLGLD